MSALTPSGTPAASQVTVVVRAWLVAGFHEAHDRFNVAAQQPDKPHRLFIPLFDALNWAGTLEEKSRPHTDPVLMALRFVRDRVLHDWADAVEGQNIPNPVPPRPLGSGVGGGGATAPTVVWEWYWKPSHQLPKLRRPFSRWQRKRDEQAHYDANFAGQPVRLALDALRGIF